MSAKKSKERRISFGEFDAAHLYSLALENFCVSKKEGVCAACLHVKGRLENMIDPKEVGRIKRQLKKHPN
jgi:hypothetical protein